MKTRTDKTNNFRIVLQDRGYQLQRQLAVWCESWWVPSYPFYEWASEGRAFDTREEARAYCEKIKTEYL